MAKPRRSGGFLATALPHKDAGVHRWILSAVYPLGPTEAAAMNDGSLVNLDPERFVAVPIITCADCNEPFEVAKVHPCEAEDAWRAIDLDPLGETR